MESRALLAFALSVAILVGYQLLFEPMPGVSPPEPEAPATVAGGEPSPVALPQPAAGIPGVEVPEPVFDVAELTHTVETDLYRLTVTSYGGRIRSFQLFDYRRDLSSDSPPLDIVKSDGPLPLGLYWTGEDGSVADDSALAYSLNVERVAAGQTTLTMTAAGAGGERISKRLKLEDGSYVLGYEVEVSAPGEGAGWRSGTSLGTAWTKQVVETSRWGGQEGPAALVEGELETALADGIEEPELHQGNIDWGGYADHYFLAAYYPQKAVPLRFSAMAGDGNAEAVLWADGTDGRLFYNLFVGPKSLHLLEKLGHGLEEAVDLGWFAVIARPLLELMLFLYKFTGNYGWSILLLTVAIRIVFYPVNKRQAAAMKAMQKVQPELKKLQAKYKDDRERLNKEMMELYRRHKVNPLSGCLPMLLQLPVFLGLYNALLQAIELRHSPFMGWITDLSQPDRLGDIAIPFVFPPGIPVMTLLMGASMVLQQRMTPQAGDPAQQKMMMLMPVVFTVMFVNFPSGLVLYWFANNILSVGQQYMTNRKK